MVKTARQKDAFASSVKKVHLYIHVPFCKRLCSFCHCTRVLFRGTSYVDAYIKYVTDQMAFLAPVYGDMDAGMLNFGGGTPSILDEQQLVTILDEVDKRFPSRDRKILMEVNPTSWTASKLKIMSDRGLARLSIGVQSLEEKILKRISCSHTAKNVLWCVRSAREAGIPCVNVDLIAGLPGQTVKGLIKDLRTLIAEGANVIHVQPYSDLPWDHLCAPGETVRAFLKRRDLMMREAVSVLKESGFQYTGLEGTYTYKGVGHGHYHEEVFFRLEAALAGFGASARGQFPGVVYYSAGASVSMARPSVNAAAQDFDYVWGQYALTSLFDGLDEQVFTRRFGVSLERSCGDGLRYLQRAGFVSLDKGVWKFSGDWKISRLNEFFILAKVLFGEGHMLRLREHYADAYDPNRNYIRDDAVLDAHRDYCLMNLYYQRCA
jgi:oxygen-independent coproporphyrinogen-3 oxidase